MKAPRSIRTRLLLWLAFLLICVLTGFGVTAYQLHRNNLFEQIDEELAFRVATLSRELRGRMGPGRFRGPPPGDWLLDRPGDPPPGRDRNGDRPGDRRQPHGFGPPKGLMDGRPEGRDFTFTTPTLNLFEDSQTNSFYFAIWSRSGSLLKASPHAPPELPIPGPDELEAHLQSRNRDTFREAFQLNALGECVLAGRSIQTDLTDLRHFAWWLAAAGSAVLALGVTGGWVLTTRAIRPVDNIATTARRIADGNLAERIRVLDSDADNELGRLAHVLNSTFERLDAAFAQQRQFTADASHELRTPISVIIAEAQTTLARERSAAEYRETVETCLDAAQQMRRLTQSLLELARFDAGQEPLEPTAFDLSERLRACADLIRPLAAQRHITLETDLPALEAHGDPDRLCQVFTNLLSNAVHYNVDNGRIHLAARTEGHTVVVTVTDTGMGIAAEDIPHIFKRFYRADKSRSNAAGRSGLGLAICKAIIEAHHGSIEVQSQPGQGSTFTVRWPMAPWTPRT